MINSDGQTVRENRGLFEKLPVRITLTISRKLATTQLKLPLENGSRSGYTAAHATHVFQPKSANRTIVLGLKIKRQDESPR
jgi:hypothetical protein